MSAAAAPLNWFDRASALVAPGWTLRRVRARVAALQLARHYEAASTGRRTAGWRSSSGDANAVMGPALVALRERARDLVRNNAYAESGLSTIVDQTVGWGITAKAPRADAQRAWDGWAGSRACDADGRHDFYGLQKLVMRTTVESGELLVRRRFRQPGDGFPLPMQLQILDPDFLDATKDRTGLAGGGRIVHGVEFDGIGRRVAYWLFSEHPGGAGSTFAASSRVGADNVLHVFKSTRPGQVRAPSWFAPVLVRFRDFDEFEDATLMKQKIAACLSVLVSDPDGSNEALGTAGETGTTMVDMLEPGAVLNVPPGRTVDVVQPPQVREYSDYVRTNLRAIATGLGVTYEDLTGDYADMPFSAARMSRLRHWARVEDWRWRLVIPQFCDPVFTWVMEAAVVAGSVALKPGELPAAIVPEWTAPPAPMIDPSTEGLAYMRNVRAGIMTWSEAVRERGYDPKRVLAELKSDAAAFDANGIVLDSDPRLTTQGGQLQGAAKAKFDPAPAPVAPPAAAGDDEDVERAAAAAGWYRRR